MKKWAKFTSICLLGLIVLAGICFAGTSPEDQKTIDDLKKTYTFTSCPVSGDKLDGEMGKPIDYLYRTTVDGKETVRLIRFCCLGCLKDFKKDPAKYLKIIDDASKTGK